MSVAYRLGDSLPKHVWVVGARSALVFESPPRAWNRIVYAALGVIIGLVVLVVSAA